MAYVTMHEELPAHATHAFGVLRAPTPLFGFPPPEFLGCVIVGCVSIVWSGR